MPVTFFSELLNKPFGWAQARGDIVHGRRREIKEGLANCLDADGGLSDLALLLLTGDGLGAHDTTTPVAAGLLVLVGVALLDGGEELGELGLVLRADLSESEDSGGLVELAWEGRIGLM